jgi:hypothetical protein
MQYAVEYTYGNVLPEPRESLLQELRIPVLIGDGIPKPLVRDLMRCDLQREGY